MKKQNGITLIALVITIIVMLILAGVTISLVVGDNGVLNQAQNAVNLTKLGTAKEQVALAWASAEADYLAHGGGQDKSTYFTASKLTNDLGQGEITAVSFGTTAAGDSELSYKVTEGGVDTYYKMQVTAGGVINIIGEPTTSAPTLSEPVITPPPTTTEETLASQISESNYGDYVDYDIDLGIVTAGNALSDSTVPKTDWRIFYEDENNVYLIASDYIPTTKFPSGVFGNNNGKYNGYWATSSSSTLSTSGTVTTNNSFLFTELSNVTTSNLNYQATATLLDSSKWSGFAKSEYVDNVSTAVIGSPTVEMWMASWNERYTDTLAFNANTTGYQVGLNSSSLSTYISNTDMQAKEGYNNTLYYPHANTSGTAWNSCYGYWLASPSAYDADRVMIVDCYGYVNYNNYSSSYCGVRPVVSLKSGITATQNAVTGIWELSE